MHSPFLSVEKGSRHLLSSSPTAFRDRQHASSSLPSFSGWSVHQPLEPLVHCIRQSRVALSLFRLSGFEPGILALKLMVRQCEQFSVESTTCLEEERIACGET